LVNFLRIKAYYIYCRSGIYSGVYNENLSLKLKEIDQSQSNMKRILDYDNTLQSIILRNVYYRMERVGANRSMLGHYDANKPIVDTAYG